MHVLRRAHITRLILAINFDIGTNCVQTIIYTQPENCRMDSRLIGHFETIVWTVDLFVTTILIMNIKNVADNDDKLCLFFIPRDNNAI